MRRARYNFAVVEPHNLTVSARCFCTSHERNRHVTATFLIRQVNTRRFCASLAAHLASRGVVFHWGSTVHQLHIEPAVGAPHSRDSSPSSSESRLTLADQEGCETELAAEAVVLAAGCDGGHSRLLRSVTSGRT